MASQPCVTLTTGHALFLASRSTSIWACVGTRSPVLGSASGLAIPVPAGPPAGPELRSGPASFVGRPAEAVARRIDWLVRCGALEVIARRAEGDDSNHGVNTGRTDRLRQLVTS